MKELQNLMSIGDVAKSFGVCVATVRRWCKNGKFSTAKSPDALRPFLNKIFKAEVKKEFPDSCEKERNHLAG